MLTASFYLFSDDTCAGKRPFETCRTKNALGSPTPGLCKQAENNAQFTDINNKELICIPKNEGDI